MRRWIASAISVCFVLGLALSAGASNAVERYEGIAYAPDDGSVLYRETHWLYRDSAAERRLVLYRCADGTPFARKQVIASTNAAAPNFDFYDAGLDYREGVSGDGTRRIVYWQGHGDAAPRRRTLDLRAEDVVDAGFDAYVRAHWDAITSRSPLRAAIVVPGRLTTVPVLITETGEGDAHVRRLRARLDAWYHLIAPTITLDYQRDNHRLLAFRGVGMIQGANGRNLSVHIRFPPEQHNASVAREEVIAAQRLPLSGQCHP